MNDKYHEIMQHVYVTDDMKERVQSAMCVAYADRSCQRRPMVAVIAACICAVLVAGVFLNVNSRQDREETTEENTVAAVYDVKECASVKELSETLGFTVREINNLPFEVERTTYFACWKEYAEITYEGASQTAVYRVTQGQTDISGDYNVYDVVKDLHKGNVVITIKGDASGYMLAIWQDAGYSYSIAFTSPVTEKQIQSILQ